MNQPRALLENHGAVRLLTLNDPDKRNAIGLEFAAEIVELTSALADDPDAHALVITGAGTAFCAGADLPDVFAQRPTEETEALLHSYYECFLGIGRIPFPTFAAVNGPAIGAGLNLALSCDIRVAGTSATFGATFSRIGLHPGGGCSYFLTQTIGAQRALNLLLEGGIVKADDALHIGLVVAVEADPLGAALALAERVATLEPPLARDIVRAVELAQTESFASVLNFETRAQAASSQTPRFRDYINQFC